MNILKLNGRFLKEIQQKFNRWAKTFLLPVPELLMKTSRFPTSPNSMHRGNSHIYNRNGRMWRLTFPAAKLSSTRHSFPDAAGKWICLNRAFLRDVSFDCRNSAVENLLKANAVKINSIAGKKLTQ
ncbi:hypothetical protein WJU16_15145 [Chitinophaga pollutisoli]|uniref:Uncharacterized protein n=1 Tax=Chitinophaga pollutisoli TaxID=3133966 RepID=A0ABZ2YHX5_9BACT